MFPLVRLGPVLLQTAGLVLLLSFWLGSTLAEREARRLGVQTSTINSGIFVALVAGLLGARLAYVARYLSTYLANPAGVLSLNTSALAVPAGVMIGVLSAGFYWWRKHMPLRQTLDAITPLLAVLAIGLGVAHLATGSAYGAPARAPWAVYLWDDYRHPAQVYEIVTATIIFGLVWRVRIYSPFSGFPFLLWLTVSAAARVLLEGYRGDSTFVLGGLRAAQLAALGVLLLGLWLMGRLAQPGVTHSQAEEPGYSHADQPLSEDRVGQETA
jgi:phosphatidylglycerol---prolipoprotein diacylglyceryl transferase